MSDGAPRRLLALDTVWWLLPLCLAAIWAFLTPVDPADFWHHAALGRSIVAARAVPTVDTFSFTQGGQPYYYQAWLGGALLYAALAAGGVTLVILVNAAALVGSTALLLRWTASRCRHLPLAAALVCASIPLVANNWNVRPQTFAIPVLLAFAWTLDLHRRTRRAPLPLLPPLMLLWVNLHGTFALGLIMLGIAAGAELLGPRSPRALGWFALTGVATLVNPRDAEIFGYLRRLLTHSTVMESIVEWQPITAQPVFGAWLLAYALLLVAAIVSARRRPSAADLALLVVLAVMAWSSLRSVMWFVWLSIPVGAEALTAGRPSWERAPHAGPAALNGALCVLFLACVAASSPFVKSSLPLDDRMRPLVAVDTPVTAVQALRDDPDPPRRLFHTMEYGSYLMWAAPERKVFADPRIELYPPELWNDYLEICRDHDALRRLDALDIDGLLLSRHSLPDLLRTVSASPAWTTRYADEKSVYLRRAVALRR